MAKRESLASGTELLAQPCSNCNAKPGESCTAPTNTGRKPVAWFHYSREAAAIHARAD